MIWPVTLAGGLVGLAVAHIPGALLGVLVGSIVDRNLAINSWPELRARMRPEAAPLLEAQPVLFMLLGYLAKSTGRDSPEHIYVARLEMQRLQLTGAAQQAAMAAFSQGKDCRLDDLRRSLQAHYAAAVNLEQLLFAGWRMALAQGRAGAKQRCILQQCADWLDCSADNFARIEVQVRRVGVQLNPNTNELDAALQVLGVNRSASLAQIKKAYRRLLSTSHPDKLIGAGASPAQVQAATEKTGTLHHAYALLAKHWQG
jgi:DnaJ like chaperone protein